MLTIKHFLILTCCCVLISCQQSDKTKQILVNPLFNGELVSCNQPVTFAGKEWFISELSMFVSNAHIGNGRQETSERVQLLTENCDGENNWQFEALVTGEGDQLFFDIAVPFSQNHTNPLTQQPPLNDSTMFWNWQLGHKFFRFDLVTDDDSWFFHLGSLGCVSAAPVRSPKEQCLQPNHVKVMLSLSTNNTINLNLEKLLQGVTLSSDNSCMSDLDTPSCPALMENIGVTGEQKIFTSAVVGS